MYKLYIDNGDRAFIPLIEGDVTWETERMGTPGKLTFSVFKDDIIEFYEGNSVRLYVNGKNLFFGFVFAKERDKNQIINVTAYDQLRYLKNKDTYVYTNMKASELVRKIAADFQLQTGVIDDTGYVVAERIRENMALFDIIYDALDLTLMNRSKLYVLYDEFGKLTLRDVEMLKVPDLVIGENTAQDFSYKTDIDSDTYNRIKVAMDNEKTGKTDVHIVKHGINQNKWGILQYYEKVNEDTNIKDKAEALLKLKNRLSRSLTVINSIGDIRVRAGSSVIVLVRGIGDISIRQYLLVEKVRHVFNNNEHWMTLDLRGDL